MCTCAICICFWRSICSANAIFSRVWKCWYLWICMFCGVGLTRRMYVWEVSGFVSMVWGCECVRLCECVCGCNCAWKRACAPLCQCLWDLCMRVGWWFYVLWGMYPCMWVYVCVGVGIFLNMCIAVYVYGSLAVYIVIEIIYSQTHNKSNNIAWKDRLSILCKKRFVSDQARDSTSHVFECHGWSLTNFFNNMHRYSILLKPLY